MWRWVEDYIRKVEFMHTCKHAHTLTVAEKEISSSQKNARGEGYGGRKRQRAENSS